jgi:hypothetical protein
MPTDWVRSGQHKLLADAQTIKLRELIIERLAISVPDKLSDLDARSWYAITRQIHAAVAAAGRATRVETFNGNYGLNRGLFSAVLAVAGLVLLSRTISEWAAGVLVLLAGLAAFRMHRFAKHYGRELFVQFLASFEFRVGKLGGRTGQGRPQAGRSRTLDAARQKTRWSEAESGGLTDSALETSDGGHGTAVRAGSGDRGPVGGQGSAV